MYIYIYRYIYNTVVFDSSVLIYKRITFTTLFFSTLSYYAVYTLHPAFFRVELHGKGGVAANRYVSTHTAVLGGAKHMGVVVGIHVIAVHEIEVLIIIDACPERVVVVLIHQVPAHVRYFQAMLLGIAHIGRKAVNAALEKAQAVHAAILFAALH